MISTFKPINATSYILSINTIFFAMKLFYNLLTIYVVFSYNIIAHSEISKVNSVTLLSGVVVAPFEVVVPENNSLFEGELSNIVLRLNIIGIDKISIMGASSKETTLKNISVKKNQKYVCKTIKLAMGPNKITINAIKEHKVIGTKTLTVFYRSDVSKKFTINPLQFLKKPFHKLDNYKLCNKCHKLELPDAIDSAPVFLSKKEDSICYNCHKGITNYSNIHGPAAAWACKACHNKKSDSLYGTLTPINDLCFSCHTEAKEKWTSKVKMHGPTVVRCTICHNSHASNNYAWLRKPVWDICVTCHDKKASGKHVIVSFINYDSHPTRLNRPPKKQPGFIWKGKVFSCASCHNPHASDSFILFQNDARKPFGLCVMCHVK